MLESKKVKSYLKELSKKHNLTQKQVNSILVYGMKNLCSMIKSGEDIRLQKFGNIYFKKQEYNNYLKGKKRNKENGKNDNDPGPIRKG